MVRSMEVLPGLGSLPAFCRSRAVSLPYDQSRVRAVFAGILRALTDRSPTFLTHRQATFRAFPAPRTCCHDDSDQPTHSPSPTSVAFTTAAGRPVWTLPEPRCGGA